MARITLRHSAYDMARRALAADSRAPGLLYDVDPEAETGHVVAWNDLDQEADRPTVLVVDDEPAIGDLLEEVLDSVGYRVVRAANGRSALAVARREHPVLVLTDRMMPEVDGVEFVRRLRSSPITRHIPVVLMSSTRPDRETMGDIPFLAKPFELDDLIRTVEDLARPDR